MLTVGGALRSSTGDGRTARVGPALRCSSGFGAWASATPAGQRFAGRAMSHLEARPATREHEP